MRHLLTVITIFAITLLLTPVAGAQYGTPDTPDTLTPAGEDDPLPGGNTPCSTVLVQGTHWGPGTQISIFRNDPGTPGTEDGACVNQGDTTVGLTGTNSPVFNAADQPEVRSVQDGARQLATATVESDGSFTVPVQVPADVEGTFSYVVVGTGERGLTREVPETVDVDLLDSFAEQEERGGLLVGQILAVVLLAVVLVAQFVGGGPLKIRRRRRVES